MNLLTKECSHQMENYYNYNYAYKSILQRDTDPRGISVLKGIYLKGDILLHKLRLPRQRTAPIN